MPLKVLRVVEPLVTAYTGANIGKNGYIGHFRNFSKKAQPRYNKWPPKLPKIHDKQLLKQVFTHKSIFINAHTSSTHNERLEFKGDSVLNFIMGGILYEEFPTDSVGDLTKKKASLVCNDTLFDFSIAYGFHKRLKVNSILTMVIFKNPKTKEVDNFKRHKAIADVFEAYVGALTADRGFAIVHEWLKLLYAPKIKEMRLLKSHMSGIDMGSKNKLYYLAGLNDISVDYQSLNDESPFQVKCIIGGLEVSQGIGSSKQLAGQHAAMKVLEQDNYLQGIIQRVRMFQNK